MGEATDILFEGESQFRLLVWPRTNSSPGAISSDETNTSGCGAEPSFELEVSRDQPCWTRCLSHVPAEAILGGGGGGGAEKLGRMKEDRSDSAEKQMMTSGSPAAT